MRRDDNAPVARCRPTSSGAIFAGRPALQIIFLRDGRAFTPWRSTGVGRSLRKTNNAMKLIDTMLRSHPRADLQHVEGYTDALNALALCAQICTSCADACLAEEELAQLRKCIRYNLDCADICAATSAVVTRQTEPSGEVLHAQLHACILTCRTCADECERHASMHDHCRICAETCRHCQERCNFLLGAISSTGVEEEEAPPTDSPSFSR